jgi:hypothetical protein
MVFLAVFAYGGHAKAEELNSSHMHIALYSYQIDFPGSSLKDHGWVTSGYLRTGDQETYTMEFALAQTRIDYRIGDDLDQTDVTFAYTNTGHLMTNHHIRGGIHYINSDDALTDECFILFGKIFYLKDPVWNAGLEIDYSIYEKSSTDTHVVQAVPSIGFYLIQNSYQETLYTESKLYYIHKSKRLETSQHSFVSFEQSLRYELSPFDATIAAWVGEQMFAVKDDGFTVYNRQDKYDGGIQFDAGYTIDNRLRIGLIIGYDWLEHTQTNDEAARTVVSVNIGANF